MKLSAALLPVLTLFSVIKYFFVQEIYPVSHWSSSKNVGITFACICTITPFLKLFCCHEGYFAMVLYTIGARKKYVIYHRTNFSAYNNLHKIS